MHAVQYEYSRVQVVSRARFDTQSCMCSASQITPRLRIVHRGSRQARHFTPPVSSAAVDARHTSSTFANTRSTQPHRRAPRVLVTRAAALSLLSPSPPVRPSPLMTPRRTSHRLASCTAAAVVLFAVCSAASDTTARASEYIVPDPAAAAERPSSFRLLKSAIDHSAASAAAVGASFPADHRVAAGHNTTGERMTASEHHDVSGSTGGGARRKLLSPFNPVISPNTFLTVALLIIGQNSPTGNFLAMVLNTDLSSTVFKNVYSAFGAAIVQAFSQGVSVEGGLATEWVLDGTVSVSTAKSKQFVYGAAYGART